MDLRRPGMDLLDLADLAAELPPLPSCALFRAYNPETWMWGNLEMLTALGVDSIQHAEWSAARLNPHAKGVAPKPPKQIPRPGVVDEEADRVHGAGSALPSDEMAEWLGGAFAELNN